jgi:cell division septation protein DedD
MPSREPELYKDKIEVSLDGRQIFYLFFGGAVIVGLVFVIGVMVGRRVEARGHLDRAQTQSASDPLAALDRLERSDNLSFHGALTGAEAPTDVERAIGELDRRRVAARADKPEVKPAKADAKPAEVKPVKPDARPEIKPEARPDAKADKPETRPEAKADKPETKADKPEAKADARSDKADARSDKADARSDKADARSARPELKSDIKAEPVTRPDAIKAKPDKHDGDKHDGDKHDGDKHDGDKKSKKHDDSATADPRSESRPDRSEARRAEARTDKPVTRPDDARPADAKVRFTLQLSSFQDRSEAEAFLTATKSAGYQAYLTEAEVSGKGTFYRVRLGSYRSLDAANDAKADYEKAAKKSAQVMRL